MANEISVLKKIGPVLDKSLLHKSMVTSDCEGMCRSHALLPDHLLKHNNRKPALINYAYEIRKINVNKKRKRWLQTSTENALVSQLAPGLVNS